MFVSEANLLIVQRVSEAEKWAEVLVNLKFKYFKAKVSKSVKLVLNIFKQHKNLVVYFEKEAELRYLFKQINDNKNAILLRELSFFAEKLHRLRDFILSRQAKT